MFKKIKNYCISGIDTLNQDQIVKIKKLGRNINDKDDFRDILEYGFEIGKRDTIGFLLLMSLTFILSRFFKLEYLFSTILIQYITNAIIIGFSNGIHLPTKKCISIGIITYFVCYFISAFISFNLIIALIIFGLCFLVFIFYAPVKDDSNIEEELYNNQKKRMLVVLLILITIIVLIPNEAYKNAILCGIVVQALGVYPITYRILEILFKSV